MLKRVIISLSLGLLVTYSGLNAQNKYLGTKTPYQPQQSVYTAAPKGYQPVFINHVGRHGARFLTKPGSDAIVLNTLILAAEKNALTQSGKRFKKDAEIFESIEKDRYENITISGHDEQQGIGNRMYTQNKNAFKDRGIDVYMTYKVRTQQSAAGFLEGLTNYPPNNIHRFIASDTSDDVLRFYDISPTYIAYSNSDDLKQREDSLINDSRTGKVAMNVCGKIFTATFLKELSTGVEIIINGKKKNIDVAVFAQSLYDVYSMQFVIQKELQQKHLTKTAVDFSAAFTQNDLQWLNRINNAADFFQKGPANNASGIQVIIAVPLLVDFINTIDSIIDGSKSTDAKLRFTHAEAISPFATLLGIPQASITASSVYHYHQVWQASGIIPMSANIQWLLYSNGKNFLIKMLLNEKEVPFPIAATHYPYYDWESVKAYYINKLTQLNTSLHADMHRYLLEVK